MSFNVDPQRQNKSERDLTTFVKQTKPTDTTNNTNNTNNNNLPTTNNTLTTIADGESNKPFRPSL